VASGLPVYDAGGGLRSYGAGVQARYQWTPQWASHVFLEYERLSGAAANSPLVTLRGSRDQIQVGTGVTYSFDIKGLW
jgi:outer membrane protein